MYAQILPLFRRFRRKSTSVSRNAAWQRFCVATDCSAPDSERPRSRGMGDARGRAQGPARESLGKGVLLHSGRRMGAHVSGVFSLGGSPRATGKCGLSVGEAKSYGEEKANMVVSGYGTTWGSPERRFEPGRTRSPAAPAGRDEHDRRSRFLLRRLLAVPAGE
jgi:hypothetical protein